MLSKILPTGLKPDQKAPDFNLQDQHGKNHTLSQYLGQWVVLYFYPKDQTFGCTKEACSFRDSRSDFEKLGASILGVSVDSVESHEAFAQKHSIDFPLLADPQKRVSEQYGVLLPLGVSNRITFLINPQGEIADNLSWVNWFRYGPQVAKRLQELQNS